MQGDDTAAGVATPAPPALGVGAAAAQAVGKLAQVVLATAVPGEEAVTVYSRGVLLTAQRSRVTSLGGSVAAMTWGGGEGDGEDGRRLSAEGTMAVTMPDAAAIAAALPTGTTTVDLQLSRLSRNVHVMPRLVVERSDRMANGTSTNGTSTNGTTNGTDTARRLTQTPKQESSTVLDSMPNAVGVSLVSSVFSVSMRAAGTADVLPLKLVDAEIGMVLPRVNGSTAADSTGANSIASTNSTSSGTANASDAFERPANASGNTSGWWRPVAVSDRFSDVCVFWDEELSVWSDYGCRTLPATTAAGGGVACACSHTTDFAILNVEVDLPDMVCLQQHHTRCSSTRTRLSPRQ